MTEKQIDQAAEDYSFEHHNPPAFYVTNRIAEIMIKAFKAGAESRQPEVDALKAEIEELKVLDRHSK